MTHSRETEPTSGQGRLPWQLKAVLAMIVVSLIVLALSGLGYL
jgi:hypothetical protein